MRLWAAETFRAMQGLDLVGTSTALTTGQHGVVLHVEDDVALSASVAALLRLSGYAVTSVEDGEAALALVTRQKLRPDVLIVDFRLPGDMNGTDVAEAICRQLGHSIPTLLLTGQLYSAEIPYLPGVPLLPLAKPVAPEILLKGVAVCVDFQRVAREVAQDSQRLS